MTSIVYVGNSNTLEVRRLKSTATNDFINNATVTVTITDDAGGEIEGADWPLELGYVESSDGNYRVTLSEDLDFAADEPYVAIIDADGGALRFGHWEVRFVPKIRRQ